MWENNLTNAFELELATDSTSENYQKALKIYQDNTVTITKTDSNEISYMVDNPNKSDKFSFYIFSLLIDNSVRGFIEVGYIKQTKVALIDYICIEKGYLTNGAFFPTLNLIQNFFKSNVADVDYWCFELENVEKEINVDLDAIILKKLICMENFIQLNMPYKHCDLGLDKEETSYEVNLCIKSADKLNKLNTKTFLKIIKSIYYDYNVAWYEFFIHDKDKLNEYKLIVNQHFIEISKKTESVDEIYSKGMYCNIEHLDKDGDSFSTDGNFPSVENDGIKSLFKKVLNFLGSFLGVMIITLLTTFLLKKFNLHLDETVALIIGAFIGGYGTYISRKS